MTGGGGKLSVMAMQRQTPCCRIWSGSVAGSGFTV